MMMGFRPKISDTLVHTSIDAVLARLYPLPTQAYCCASMCSSLATVGSAVEMMVMSSAPRNRVRHSESMTRRRRHGFICMPV